MKTLLKITLILAVGLGANAALAFHDGGVAECAGCHTMHNSQDGALVDSAHPTGNAYLLASGNASDTCLSCHAGYGQFAGGTGFGPGGDFYWLTKTFTWTAHGTVTSAGDSHGHNVISPARGLIQDATLNQAPGGTFLSQYLGCTSCHDPHGNQNFRILYGTANGPVYNGGRYDFDAEAPLAKGNSRRTILGGGGNETNSDHTIYKSGMSEWCANCHTNFHSDNTTNFVHPTGEEMGSTVAAAYNAYISTDQIVGGDPATSYWGLVPFEDVQVDLDVADPQNATAGPDGQDQVMCLSCHRAHASPFQDIARWDMAQTFIIESHPQVGDGNATQADSDNKYYQYTFETNQRSLCNKCHIKDEGDAPF